MLKDLAADENDENERIKEYFFCNIKKLLYGLDIKEEDLPKIINCIVRLKLAPVVTSIPAIKEAMQVASSSKARERLTKQYLIALGFSRQDANDYVEVEDYGNEVWMAASENVDFYTTMEVAFDQGQDHITHMNTHYAKCDRVVQGIQGGEDIVQGFHFLVNCLSNTEKHLQAIENSIFFKSKAKEFQQIQDFFEAKLKQISQIIQQMQAKQQQAAQQAQQNGQNGNGQQQEATAKRKMESFQLQQQMVEQQTQNKIKNDNELASLKKELALLKQSVDLTNKKLNAVPNIQNSPQTNGARIPSSTETAGSEVGISS